MAGTWILIAVLREVTGLFFFLSLCCALYFKRSSLLDGVELGQEKKQGDQLRLVVGDGGLAWASMVEVETGGQIQDLMWNGGKADETE